MRFIKSMFYNSAYEIKLSMSTGTFCLCADNIVLARVVGL